LIGNWMIGECGARARCLPCEALAKQGPYRAVWMHGKRKTGWEGIEPQIDD